MESWIYRGEDGAVVWHVENDGYPAVYCGLDPVDIVITSEKFGRGLRGSSLYAEVKVLLALGRSA